MRKRGLNLPHYSLNRIVESIASRLYIRRKEMEIVESLTVGIQRGKRLNIFLDQALRRKPTKTFATLP